jgi:hypothetical protein
MPINDLDIKDNNIFALIGNVGIGYGAFVLTN